MLAVHLKLTQATVYVDLVRGIACRGGRLERTWASDVEAGSGVAHYPHHGLCGARDEFHLAAIVQNLKTMAPRLLGPPSDLAPA
jgi:hypothetical protein